MVDNTKSSNCFFFACVYTLGNPNRDKNRSFASDETNKPMEAMVMNNMKDLTNIVGVTTPSGSNNDINYEIEIAEANKYNNYSTKNRLSSRYSNNPSSLFGNTTSVTSNNIGGNNNNSNVGTSDISTAESAPKPNFGADTFNSNTNLTEDQDGMESESGSNDEDPLDSPVQCTKYFILCVKNYYALFFVVFLFVYKQVQQGQTPMGPSSAELDKIIENEDDNEFQE